MSKSNNIKKNITNASNCSAAGGEYFNYCPQTGKYYCCNVNSSSDYSVCSGTDGACSSNSILQNCVCPFSQMPILLKGTWREIGGQEISIGDMPANNKGPTATVISGSLPWKTGEITYISFNTIRYTWKTSSGRDIWTKKE